MITTLHVPEFAKNTILTLLADTAFTWDDVVANTNRPDDLACIERKFGDIIPVDCPITVVSTTAYRVLSLPYTSPSIYFQVLPSGEGCIIIDVDQLNNITRTDMAIVLHLINLSNRGDFTIAGDSFDNMKFYYYGNTITFPEIIAKTSKIFEADITLIEDPKMVNAIGKYSQQWYRDAAIAVANETGVMDQEYLMVRDLVA